jgi:hypothetical protein
LASPVIFTSWGKQGVTPVHQAKITKDQAESPSQKLKFQLQQLQLQLLSKLAHYWSYAIVGE